MAVITDMIDYNRVVPVIKADPTMTPDEKKQAVQSLMDPKTMQNLAAGGAGAGLGYVIAKYFGLSTKAQILLSLAGFGIGRIVLRATQHAAKQPRFANYNKDLKMYELNENHKRTS